MDRLELLLAATNRAYEAIEDQAALSDAEHAKLMACGRESAIRVLAARLLREAREELQFGDEPAAPESP